jgi:starch phosphorylase
MQYEEPTPFRLDGSSSFRRVETAGKPARFTIDVGGETVWVEAYKQRIGDTVTLYLLTTDVEGNSDYWREIFDEIYWGDDDQQIKERIVFGVGGMKLLEYLKVKPTIVHIQEGRPSFVALPLLQQAKQKLGDVSFEDLLHFVRERTRYTNHTLVASGIHSYDRALVEKYVMPIAADMGLDGNKIIELGLLPDGRFHTTHFALNVSKMANSVSAPHGKLAKQEFPSFNWINVTNGVYMGRWQEADFRNYSLTDHEVWKAHLEKKHSLMREVTARVGFGYDPHWLTISWARRISGYKQLGNIFEDVERLTKIVSDATHPVILLIAGKAHPGDTAGKEFIRHIIELMKGPLSGHALFVHNYDIALAKELVSGSDVWMNTPEFGREASGTSGMKAISNGVLQATVADGWAAEVDWTDTGWVLDHTRLTESIYETLERVVPLYYQRNSEGVPEEWVKMMRKSISLAEKYSTKRMLGEYRKKLYQL